MYLDLYQAIIVHGRHIIILKWSIIKILSDANFNFYSLIKSIKKYNFVVYTFTFIL